LVFSRWSLPVLESISFKSHSFIGLLELLAPFRCMPKLLTLWKATFIDRFLTPDETRRITAPVYCSSAPGWPELQGPCFSLPQLLVPCRYQPSDEEPVLQSSSDSIRSFFFILCRLLWAILVSQEPSN
jgi:hypothetical protein